MATLVRSKSMSYEDRLKAASEALKEGKVIGIAKMLRLLERIPPTPAITPPTPAVTPPTPTITPPTPVILEIRIGSPEDVAKYINLLGYEETVNKLAEYYPYDYLFKLCRIAKDEKVRMCLADAITKKYRFEDVTKVIEGLEGFVEAGEPEALRTYFSKLIDKLVEDFPKALEELDVPTLEKYVRMLRWAEVDMDKVAVLSLRKIGIHGIEKLVEKSREAREKAPNLYWNVIEKVPDVISTLPLEIFEDRVAFVKIYFGLEDRLRSVLHLTLRREKVEKILDDTFKEAIDTLLTVKDAKEYYTNDKVRLSASLLSDVFYEVKRRYNVKPLAQHLATVKDIDKYKDTKLYELYESLKTWLLTFRVTLDKKDLLHAIDFIRRAVDAEDFTLYITEKNECWIAGMDPSRIALCIVAGIKPKAAEVLGLKPEERMITIRKGDVPTLESIEGDITIEVSEERVYANKKLLEESHLGDTIPTEFVEYVEGLKPIRTRIVVHADEFKRLLTNTPSFKWLYIGANPPKLLSLVIFKERVGEGGIIIPTTFVKEYEIHGKVSVGCDKEAITKFLIYTPDYYVLKVFVDLEPPMIEYTVGTYRYILFVAPWVEKEQPPEVELKPEYVYETLTTVDPETLALAFEARLFDIVKFEGKYLTLIYAPHPYDFALYRHPLDKEAPKGLYWVYERDLASETINALIMLNKPITFYYNDKLYIDYVYVGDKYREELEYDIEALKQNILKMTLFETDITDVYKWLPRTRARYATLTFAWEGSDVYVWLERYGEIEKVVATKLKTKQLPPQPIFGVGIDYRSFARIEAYRRFLSRLSGLKIGVWYEAETGTGGIVIYTKDMNFIHVITGRIYDRPDEIEKLRELINKLKR